MKEKEKPTNQDKYIVILSIIDFYSVERGTNDLACVFDTENEANKFIQENQIIDNYDVQATLYKANEIPIEKELWCNHY